jgi:hypothetical protein
MTSERNQTRRWWQQLTIRELLLPTLAAAMVAGWWVDRSRLQDRIEIHDEAARRAENVAVDLLRELMRKAAMESITDAASKGAGFTGSPGRRRGDQDERLYTLGMGGSTLTSFERQLMLKSGINRPDAIVLRLYPEEVEDRLAGSCSTVIQAFFVV